MREATGLSATRANSSRGKRPALLHDGDDDDDDGKT